VYWTQILEKREESKSIPLSPERLQAMQVRNEEIEDYLYGNYIKQFTSQQTISDKEN